MRNILRELLDFFLPLSHFSGFASKLSQEILQNKAKPQHIEEKVFVLFQVKDSVIRKSVWALKYHNQKTIADMFGAVLYDHLLDELSDSLLFEDFNMPLLVPIPLSKKRLRERGYNQSELIAISLSLLDSSRSFTLCSNVLIRTKETASQARMQGRKSREENMKNAFSIKDSGKIKNRNIILLDDVITTGATMREAKQVLLRAGAKNVYCVALAH